MEILPHLCCPDPQVLYALGASSPGGFLEFLEVHARLRQLNTASRHQLLHFLAAVAPDQRLMQPGPSSSGSPGSSSSCSAEHCSGEVGALPGIWSKSAAPKAAASSAQSADGGLSNMLEQLPSAVSRRSQATALASLLLSSKKQWLIRNDWLGAGQVVESARVVGVMGEVGKLLLGKLRELASSLKAVNVRSQAEAALGARFEGAGPEELGSVVRTLAPTACDTGSGSPSKHEGLGSSVIEAELSAIKALGNMQLLVLVLCRVVAQAGSRSLASQQQPRAAVRGETAAAAVLEQVCDVGQSCYGCLQAYQECCSNLPATAIATEAVSSIGNSSSGRAATLMEGNAGLGHSSSTAHAGLISNQGGQAWRHLAAQLPVAVAQQLQAQKNKAAGAAIPQGLGAGLGVPDQQGGSPVECSSVVMSLPEAVELCMVVVNALPLPVGCNNPSCGSLGGPSEVAAAGKRCGACKIAHYCSAACQKADWKGHREACAAFKV